MNKLILSTGSDENYLNKITFYLDTIEKNSNFDKNYLIFLGDSEINLEYNKIEISKISRSQIECLTYINCLQHGEFIKSENIDNDTEDEDIIFFTDGDMFLQRNLAEDEKNWLRNLKDNDVYVGYNSSPTDTLLDEYRRLAGPTEIRDDIFKVNLTSIKIYNTGVLAMNKKTWKKLCCEYVNLFDKVDSMFVHYAKQQWLISFIIGTMDFNIIEMPYDIHNHTHYESPIGTKIDENRVVTFNDKVVLFKHKWI